MSRARNAYVLDASALLSYLAREPGHERVARRLDRAAVSTINLSEVLAKLLEKGASPVQALEIIAALALETIPFDEDLARRTALLRAPTAHLGLSLADRACLATAQRLGAAVVTTDRVWQQLKIGLPIEVARAPH